jgi:hypothetical protein
MSDAFLVSKADSGEKITRKVDASRAFGVGNAVACIRLQGAQSCASEYDVGS